VFSTVPNSLEAGAEAGPECDPLVRDELFGTYASRFYAVSSRPMKRETFVDTVLPTSEQAS
jgi:uncharacterized FlgJ-related protein